MSQRILRGLSHLRNYSPSRRCTHTPPPEILPFLPWTKEMNNPPSSATLAVTFSEGDAKQDNTNVPQSSPRVASRRKTRLKAMEAPREEIESEVHEEVCNTPKELNGFANSFRQKSGEHVWEWILIREVWWMKHKTGSN